MNKEKDVDSKAEASRLPSSLPVHSSSSSSGSVISSSSELKFSSNLTDRSSESSSVMSTTGLSSSTTYQKNKYGFEERLGSVKKSGDGIFEVYEKNKYGFDEKVGSIRQQSSNSKGTIPTERISTALRRRQVRSGRYPRIEK